MTNSGHNPSAVSSAASVIRTVAVVLLVYIMVCIYRVNLTKYMTLYMYEGNDNNKSVCKQVVSDLSESVNE